MNELKNALFQAMRSDIGVMAEWGDDEKALYNEILTADDEILTEYKKNFLEV